jgi:hypothetical protein
MQHGEFNSLKITRLNVERVNTHVYHFWSQRFRSLRPTVNNRLLTYTMSIYHVNI